MLFLNLIDRFKIVLESLKYQLLLGLYVSVKKKVKKISFNTIFLGKISRFLLIKTVLFFWLKSGQNEHQNLFYSLLGPLCKNLGWVQFFFFRILQVRLLAVKWDQSGISSFIRSKLMSKTSEIVKVEGNR